MAALTQCPATVRRSLRGVIKGSLGELRLTRCQIIMEIVITYLAPKTGGHSGSAGKQSEMHFESFGDMRKWVLANIPEEQRVGIKVWVDDLRISGTKRDKLFNPVQYRWVNPERFF
ncbi:hypothetical protein [Devosia aurantiaca]|uniref:Uncharacterized protein n=1 Tax=Devosia aurantiaca TaxID=2714858 RepID=A0A6M1SX70_9HYPH|nr:hypothetical protein [Devosia aurantiaca]NGP18903.1 hypothetical protein [Devosia aurantiaca]